MKTVQFLSLLFVSFTGISAEIPLSLKPIVQIEEEVYQYESADNGAGPMWCSGSSCLVQIGNQLFASGLETVKSIAPLNNCRWVLYQKMPVGWQKILTDEKGLTREPCPMVCYPDNTFFLSTNPTLASHGKEGGGPAKPEVLRFSTDKTGQGFEIMHPTWKGSPSFTEHSYRSFAADGQCKELILFQNVGYTHAEWAFLDKFGKWSAQGKLLWPWGADYAKPQPIRVCYPNVALRNKTVHFCGVSDIVEPNPKWREAKKKITGRDWDYDFRRLFYTWTPDISKEEFKGWIEIASREETSGWITPGDLWLAPDGSAHIIWTERAIDERLRAEFYPNAQQSYQLNYAVVRNGKVIQKSNLIESGNQGEIPGRARFHASPDSQLFAIIYISGINTSGKSISENRIMKILGPGSMQKVWQKIPFKKPFNDFFTASERAGCTPSNFIDILGTQINAPMKIAYARVKI